MSPASLQRSHTAPSDAFDHAINLVDATSTNDGANDTPPVPVESGGASNNESEKGLSRQWTQSTLRKQLAQRKYAKYQREDAVPEGAQVEVGEGDENAENEGTKPGKQGTWGTQGRLRDKIPFRGRRKKYEKRTEDSVIDILYENQRGAFLCGIPMYSAKSLLNFDPAQWQNAQFEDSPVDIHDAQLPDPSWRWAWRTWYVDMSHDVDEQGWEYSLNFGFNFSWHGNHPWFHSFVRRRRWLRKRTKTPGALSEKRDGKSMKEAHLLNNDYFTIHPATRDRSRDSSADRGTTHRSSTVGSLRYEAEEEEPNYDDISDIPALLTAVKKARVDREKILAVNGFLQHGGEEIHYLADNISSIMADLIYQTSRRQLQQYLLRNLDSTTKNLASLPADSDEKAAEQRRIENITKAVQACGMHTDDEGRWGSDLQSNIRLSADGSDHQGRVRDVSPHVDKQGHDARNHIEAEGGVGEDIKGISKDAEISKTPGIRRPTVDMEGEARDEKDVKPIDKGKGKEKA